MNERIVTDVNGRVPAPLDTERQDIRGPGPFEFYLTVQFRLLLRRPRQPDTEGIVHIIDKTAAIETVNLFTAVLIRKPGQTFCQSHHLSPEVPDLTRPRAHPAVGDEKKNDQYENKKIAYPAVIVQIISYPFF